MEPDFYWEAGATSDRVFDESDRWLGSISHEGNNLHVARAFGVADCTRDFNSILEARRFVEACLQNRKITR